MEGEKKEKKYCYEYPRPAVTTDSVVFGFDGKELKVLLIKRGIEPFKDRWALPGGFLKEKESAEMGAIREVEEETGLWVEHVEQVITMTNPFRDPRERVVTIAVFALVKTTAVKGGDDAAEAEWFPIDNLPPLAFDHDSIFDWAMVRLRQRIHFYPIGKDLLPETFTMRELQTLYEAILQVKFDRRNFAKKMLHLGILTPIEEPKQRPQRFKFNLTKYLALKKSGFKREF